jgi:ribosome-binding protein aMBF1 (putative translation factor)
MSLPTGRQLKAARALAGLEQRQVATKARINVTTLHRMEACGNKPARGQAENVQAVIDVLKRAGVELTDNPVGVHMIARGR